MKSLTAILLHGPSSTWQAQTNLESLIYQACFVAVFESVLNLHVSELSSLQVSSTAKKEEVLQLREEKEAITNTLQDYQDKFHQQLALKEEDMSTLELTINDARFETEGSYYTVG